MSTERKLGEQAQPLQAEISYASLDRSIEFVFPNAEAAKAGALKAMGAIHLDEGIRVGIEGVDLSRGRGRVGWDYYQFYALKTDLDFEQLKDSRWTLGVNKVYSEGSSLRGEVEKAVGESSLIAGASISLKLPTPEQGRAYLQTVGMDLSPELLARHAQDRAYWKLSILIRDMSAGYDHKTQKDIVDRPEDMGQVLIDFAQQSDRDTQGKILGVVDKRMAETHMEDWTTLQYRYPGGSLEAALANDDFEPVKAMQEIFEAMDKAAKPNLLGRRRLHQGSYSHFYLDLLEKGYDVLGVEDKARLYTALYAKCKSRGEKKGGVMPTEMRFDSQNRSKELSEYSLSVGATAPINSEYFVARASTRVDGTFDLVSRTFKADDYPTEFSLRVYPTPEYRYSNDRNVQALINVTASRLALQEPDYLTAKMRSARADNSHNWAIDKLGTTLLNTDDPYLQSMGLDVLAKRTQSGSKNPRLN